MLDELRLETLLALLWLETDDVLLDDWLLNELMDDALLAVLVLDDDWLLRLLVEELDSSATDWLLALEAVLVLDDDTDDAVDVLDDDRLLCELRDDALDAVLVLEELTLLAVLVEELL